MDNCPIFTIDVLLTLF